MSPATYDRLVDFYGMRQMLMDDSLAGVDRVFLFNLYCEFAFVGFIVLMALLLESMWRK